MQSKKSLKMKMKYTKKNEKGEVYIDGQLYQKLKKEQTIICYNEEERRNHLLEFFCCVCNRHSKGLKAGESHWSCQKHKKQLFGHQSKTKHVENLRKLTPEEELDLSKLLEKTVEERLMNEDNFTERLNVCRDVEETIKATGVYDVYCGLYGSTLTRLGSKDANINIDIKYDIEKISKSYPDLGDTAKLLVYLYATIKESNKFCDVKDLFHTNVPKFTFTHVESGLGCIVCPHFKPGLRTSWLIKDYIDIDARVKILCVAFRHWAMVCGLDDVDGGSLPSYCYTMMVIHFLQQVDPPVLPVIDFRNYQYLPKDIKPPRGKNMVLTEKVGLWRTNNTMSLGSLWVRLFGYYLNDFFFKTLVVNITQHPPMTKQLRGLNSRRISIEDPFFSKDNVANSLLSSTVMDYFTVCLEKSYKHYSLCPEADKGDKTIVPDVPSTSKKSERKKLKEEKRRSNEEKRSAAESRKNEKKPDKLFSEKDSVPGEVDSTKEAKVDSRGDKDGISSKMDDVTPDSIPIFPQGGKDPEFSDTDSENEENLIDFHDSHDDVEDSDSGDSSDGDEDFADNDNDTDSENEENVGAQSSRSKEGDNEHSADNEQKTDDTATVLMGSKETEPKQHSPIEGDFNRLKDYDSQYDGDVESQDDSKHVQIKRLEMEGEQLSDKNKDQLRVKSESSNDEDARIGDTVITNSLDISSNIEKLTIGDHSDKISVPQCPSIEKIVQSIINDMVGNVDSQVDTSEVDTPIDYFTIPPELQDKMKDSDKQSDDATHKIPPVTTKSPTNEHESITEPTNDVQNEKKEEEKFSFERKFLAPVRRVPLYCKICNADGHRSSECSSMSVGNIVELKQLPQYFNLMLTRVCHKIFEDNKLSNHEKENRKKILQEVERHLRKYLDGNVRLALFGSSVNNFGFQGSNRGRSDMDICMRLKSDEPPDGLDYGAEIVKVSKALDKNQNYQKVMYIKSAKVPIVKFTIRDSNLEGDISLYNCLALKNSTMLKDYSIIDKRVRVLGYCIKVFAKLCEIGDASRGSLSSYAYILLMLYYLQRCEPPVVPVLQELYDHSKRKPISVVESWDTWYFGDMRQLSTAWTGYNMNQQTVGELWLGFFRFYIEKFDFARNVIAMKQIKTLTKFEKSWTRATMAIEDPYNLQHNLGAGISRNMFKYLLSCFRNARSHFGTINNTLRQDATVEFLTAYFYNREHLTDNKLVPKDRLCHRCGRIGHTASNCAEKIVADRERRRHDSERTYSSENGDSDNNNSSKKGRMSNITCYGCQKTGHRVANCPEKNKSKTPSKQQRNGNRERTFSEKSSPSVISQAQDSSSLIQAATDFHPLENIDIVLPKSEMTIRESHPKQRGKQQHKLRSNVKDIEVSHVNNLFNSPRRMQSVDGMEQTKGYTFPNKTIEEVGMLQPSAIGVSFLESGTNHGKNFHSSPGGVSPSKTPGKGSLLPSPNRSYPAFSNQSFQEFPSLGITSGNSGGFQPLSAEIQGHPRWLPQSPDYTSVGQGTLQFNPAIGSPVSRPIPTPLMSTPLYVTSAFNPANVSNSNTRQRVDENINASPKQGFHFTTPPQGMPSSYGRGKHANKGNVANQGPLYHSKSLPENAKPNAANKFHRSTSTPEGKTRPMNVQWTQAPPPPPGFRPVHTSSASMRGNYEEAPNTTSYDNFVMQYNNANSPPKGSPVKEFTDNMNSPMKYDEEYPPTNERGAPSSSSRGRGKRGKRKGH